MSTESRKDTLAARLQGRVEYDRPLAPLTTFETGGPARFFFEAVTERDLSDAISAARDLDIPVYVIGGGSNLLVSDAGIDGLVIKVSVRGIELADGSGIVCGAGESLTDLVKFASDHALSGLEFAAGIYGTVGGAICGNAGAYGGEIGDVVRDVTLVDQHGAIKTVGADQCGFAYRDSALKSSGQVVVRASLALNAGDSKAIRSRVDEIMALRNAKFPPDIRSAGCFFKNIPDASQPRGKLPAGKLLEEIGAKDMSVGGARVSAMHANVIVNAGRATSKDIRRLADKLKEKVLEKFGITLQEEITQLGDF